MARYMVVVDGYGDDINEAQCVYGGFGTRENAEEFAESLQTRLDRVCEEYMEDGDVEQVLTASVLRMRTPRLKQAEDDLREALRMERRST